MNRYRKKPVVIEAIQFTKETIDRIKDLGFTIHIEGTPGKLVIWLEIKTLEGVMRADLGDWVIRGIRGEFYPCKPDIFAATYEPVDEMECVVLC